MKKRTIAMGAVALATAGLGLAQTSSADASGGRIDFALQRSPGIVAAGCLPYAWLASPSSTTARSSG